MSGELLLYWENTVKRNEKTTTHNKFGFQNVK